MVRLTAELIWKSPHFFNAVKDRELDLRANKISVLENLGATEDQFDAFDLSDNEIVKLDNFPSLLRLSSLFLNNNRLTRINPKIGGLLPNLHTLVLTNNRLVNLVDIDPLSSLPKLKFLSLLDNTITKKPNYRLYVIHKLRALRVLDFKKVRAKERSEADRLFGETGAKDGMEEDVKVAREDEEEEEEEEEEDDDQMVSDAKVSTGPTPEQIIAIKAAIVNSQTLEEVARLEKALKSGQLPVDFEFPNDKTQNNESAPMDQE